MKYTDTPTIRDIQWAEFLLCPEDLLEFRCQNPKGDILDNLVDFHRKNLLEPCRYRFRVARNPDGYPLVLGGWDNVTGVAWFITTTEAQKFPLKTLKAIKECRRDALSDCPQLVNVMMRSNKQHVALLEAIGAEFVGPIYTIGSEPFQAFIIEGGDPCARQ